MNHYAVKNLPLNLVFSSSFLVWLDYLPNEWEKDAHNNYGTCMKNRTKNQVDILRIEQGYSMSMLLCIGYIKKIFTREIFIFLL